MEQTPQSLLNRLRADPGDQAAWTRLVRLYTPFLRGVLSQFVPAGDIDDVVQEVLGTVHRRVGGFVHHEHNGAFRGWLRAIVRHKVSEHRRQRRIEQTDDQLDALGNDDSAISRRIDREHDEHVFRTLCDVAREEFPDWWTVFKEYAIDDGDASAVADRNGVSVHVVYTAKSRILAWLRAEGKGLIDTRN